MSFTDSANATNNAKKKGTDTRVVYLLIGVTAVLGVLVWSYFQKPDKSIPQEKGVIYYTGVRFNQRNGKWVDPSGRVYDPPPGESKPTPLPPDTHSISE